MVKKVNQKQKDEVDLTEEELVALKIQKQKEEEEKEAKRLADEKAQEEAILARAAAKAEERRLEQIEFARLEEEKRLKKIKMEESRKKMEAEKMRRATIALEKEKAEEERKRLLAEQIKKKQAEENRIKKLIAGLNELREKNSKKIASEELNSEIRQVCIENDIETLKEYIDEWEGHRVIDECDCDGWSPLHWACKKGSTECVKYIIDTTWINKHESERLQQKAINARIDVVDELGQTYLMMAAIAGSVDIVKYLISKGAGKNIQNDDGFTAYLWAAYKGKLPVIQALAESQARTDLLTRGGLTALEVANISGDDETIKYLKQIDEARRAAMAD